MLVRKCYCVREWGWCPLEHYQRKGMGVLEYQTMPSLHDVALGILEYQAISSLRDVALGILEYQAMPSLRDLVHDGWLCTFTTLQQLEIPSAPSWGAPAKATGTVGKIQAVRPVHHIQNHTCRVTLLQL